jgi:hypothetical protein
MVERKVGKAVRIPDDFHATLTRLAKRDATSVQTLLVELATEGLRARAAARATPDARATERRLIGATLPADVLKPGSTLRIEASGVAVVPPGEGRGVGLLRIADETCRHPVSRRIGTGCGACGKDAIR